MIYVNKNSALETLQGLVEQSFNKTQSYMPEGFSEKQQEAVNLFKQRIFLEEVIEESVGFNKNLNWTLNNENLKLVSSAEELIEVYKLRSDVYAKVGYNTEIIDPIEGLNFDMFDKTSAIIYYSKEKSVNATCRLIFDSKDGLPSEEKFSFNEGRKQYSKIGEISRLTIDHRVTGLGLEFKSLMAGIHNVFINNNINMTFSGIKKEHFKLYSKFGGIGVAHELEGYGKLKIPFLIITWNPSEISPFFKRAFLNSK